MKKMNKLCSDSVKAWYLLSLLFLLICSVLYFFIYIFSITKLAGGIRILFISVFSVLLAIVFISSLIVPPLKYKKFFYSIMKDRILLIGGIYYLKREVILIDNIEHIETVSPLYLRFFRLYNVIIYTSASKHKLPALCESQVKEILKAVKKGDFYEKSVYKKNIR